MVTFLVLAAADFLLPIRSISAVNACCRSFIKRASLCGNASFSSLSMRVSNRALYSLAFRTIR
jgi:hypothetical protein